MCGIGRKNITEKIYDEERKKLVLSVKLWGYKYSKQNKIVDNPAAK